MFLRLAKTHPFKFGVAFSCFKTSASDLLVQKVVEKRENIDWRRNTAFATFGFFYLGGVQYFLYVPFFSRLFPGAASFAAKPVAEKLRDASGLRALVAQVFLDQAVHHPLMYFPVFYMMKDFVVSNNPDPFQALNEYKSNMKEDLIALWKVWVPSTIFNFAFLPMWARIPWVASTSLIWTCILSAMRGASDLPAPGVIGPSVDHVAMELFERSLLSPAPWLSSRYEHLLVNVHGQDRNGIIVELSRRIFDAGGMITTSRMVKLGGDFSILLHTSVDPSNLEALQAALREPLDGVIIDMHKINPIAASATIRTKYCASVRLTGSDRPGLLFRLSQLLARHDMNVENLQTEQHHAPTDSMTPQVFTLHGLITSNHVPDPEALADDVAKLQEELGVLCEVEKVGVERVLARTLSR